MKRTRLPAEERKKRIVDAAFHLLATEGFEGLRTRDVAAKAKINIATLHHHFPSKEDLVGAVADALEQAFTTDKIVPVGNDAPALLRQEFADMRRYVKQRPELLSVYAELSLRALRDPKIRAIVERLSARWVESVARIIRQGIDEQHFATEDPLASARIVVGALWTSKTLLQLEGRAFDRLCGTLESLLRKQDVRLAQRS
ncbi:Transcriptional regulator, TetR family protein [Minicystis rosea]|nr:Transcriptional regulator, TetR family protein [Minicystis rosea]